jgi:RNA polymerase sigma-70 factor (ECF subfamily)
MQGFQTEPAIPTEEELVERARAGDRLAADTLFERHARACYQAAFRILRNREEAEDALQDGLLLAFRHFSSFQARAPFRSWLRRIVVNAAFTRLRGQAGRTVISLEDLPDAGRAPAALDPYEMAARAELRRLVLARLESVSPHACWVVVLYHFYGFRTRDIARTLRLPDGTVRGSIFRVRRLIQEGLEPVRRLTHSPAGRYK